jgi:hypothetical protein
MRRLAGVLAVVLWIVGCASGGGVKSVGGGKAVQVAYHPKPGSSRSYRVSVTITNSFGQMETRMLIDAVCHVRCVDVVGDTLARMEMTIEKVRTTAEQFGKMSDVESMSRERPVTVRFGLTPSGDVRDPKLSDIELSRELEGLLKGLFVESIFEDLPDTLMAEGVRVRRTETERMEQGSFRLKVLYESKGLRRMDGMECIELAVSGEGSGRMQGLGAGGEGAAASRLKYVGTSLIDLGTWLPVKFDGQMTTHASFSTGSGGLQKVTTVIDVKVEPTG